MRRGRITGFGHGGKGSVSLEHFFFIRVEDARGQGCLGVVVDDPHLAICPTLLHAVQTDEGFEYGGKRNVAAEIAGQRGGDRRNGDVHPLA